MSLFSEYIKKIKEGTPSKDGLFDVFINFRNETFFVENVKFSNGQPDIESEESFRVIAYCL